MVRLKSKIFQWSGVLAAPAVMTTVAEAFRVGKKACHRPHFTAISGPVKVWPPENETLCPA
jgi:hypothetical protein